MALQANPEGLAKIILEDPEDESKFVRAYSTAPVPFNAKEVLGKRGSFSPGCLIRFRRTMDNRTPLIKSLKQNVQLRSPIDTGVLMATFKITDVAAENTEALQV